MRELVSIRRINELHAIDENYILHRDIERYLQDAEGKSALNPKVEREGIVFRTISGDFNFKAVSNRFLLKND